MIDSRAVANRLRILADELDSGDARCDRIEVAYGSEIDPSGEHGGWIAQRPTGQQDIVMSIYRCKGDEPELPNLT